MNGNNELSNADKGHLPVEFKPKKKTLSLRNRKIAEMAARGWGADEISKECNISKSRCHHILRTDEVMEYVVEILRETFNEGDRILSMLYKKAMMGLDEDLTSPIADIRHKAREQVLKCWGFKDGGGNVSIQQIFQGAGSKSAIESMDQIIMRMRKERGLGEAEDGEDVVDVEAQEITQMEREREEDE